VSLNFKRSTNRSDDDSEGLRAKYWGRSERKKEKLKGEKGRKEEIRESEKRRKSTK